MPLQFLQAVVLAWGLALEWMFISICAAMAVCDFSELYTLFFRSTGCIMWSYPAGFFGTKFSLRDRSQNTAQMSPKFLLIIRCVLALIWLYNGLWLKILYVDPHHLEILQAVLQASLNQAANFLNLIGALETLLGIGILSGLFHRFVNYFQVFILVAMNCIGIVSGEGTIGNPAGLLIMNLPTILCAIAVARYGPGAWALALPRSKVKAAMDPAPEEKAERH